MKTLREFLKARGFASDERTDLIGQWVLEVLLEQKRRARQQAIKAQQHRDRVDRVARGFIGDTYGGE